MGVTLDFQASLSRLPVLEINVDGGFHSTAGFHKGTIPPAARRGGSSYKKLAPAANKGAGKT